MGGVIPGHHIQTFNSNLGHLDTSDSRFNSTQIGHVYSVGTDTCLVTRDRHVSESELTTQYQIERGIVLSKYRVSKKKMPVKEKLITS